MNSIATLPRLPEFLFHGSAREFKRPDVTLGRSHKDFGKGFYMALSAEQAIGMMHKKFREEVSRRRDRSTQGLKEVLYRIAVDTDLWPSLKVKVFEKADKEWLDFILLCRPSEALPHDYDVVIGPTADDDTNRALKAYYDGLYGIPGSARAKELLLEVLEVEKLGHQLFVGKQSVADRLIKRFESVDWRSYP